jgi:hypothetical protein
MVTTATVSSWAESLFRQPSLYLFRPSHLFRWLSLKENYLITWAVEKLVILQLFKQSGI